MTRRYLAYKETGFDGLEQIPSAWTAPELKRFANLSYGDALSSEMRDHYGKIPVYGSNGPVGTHSVANGLGPVILVGRKGSYGALNWCDTDCSAIDTVYFIDSRHADCNLRWLYWALNIARFEGSSQDTGVPGLSRSVAHLTRLPLPPLPEQTAIAAFLDRETAKIDALVAEQRRLIDLLKEKRQAVISHAVTRGLNHNAPMKPSGIDWLGDVPEGWEVVPFKKVVSYQEGPGIMAVDFHETGIPLMRISGVQERWTTLNGCNFLDPELVQRRWAHFRLELGDLVISASASMGTICEVREDCVGAVPYTGLIRIKPRDERIARDFIRAFLGSSFFNIQIDQLKAGATIQHFGPTHLGQIQIALPPRNEQAAITDQIQKVSSDFAQLVFHGETAITLLQERRAALISAAVTGKIDVRHLAQTEDAA